MSVYFGKRLLIQYLNTGFSSFFIRKIHDGVNNATKYLTETERPHKPVMLEEVLTNLDLKPGNVFLDMTFGAGGHSSAILERNNSLTILALDRDPVAHKYAIHLSKKYPNQVIPLLGKFSDLPELLNERGIDGNQIDGVLFDLGCSSMQFDNPERGFSISQDGPLDMRMDCERIPKSVTAADVVAYALEDDLYKIFKIYGEERKARKIARAIVQARTVFNPLTTTYGLKEVVEVVCSDVRFDKLHRKAHTATKIFQALRIFVNNELNEVNYGLHLAHNYLKENGVAVALTFHSLEDKIVKKHFTNNISENYKSVRPLKYFDGSAWIGENDISEKNVKLWEVINKKVIVPTEEEVSLNPRSRSAKLRAARKTQLITWGFNAEHGKEDNET